MLNNDDDDKLIYIYLFPSISFIVFFKKHSKLFPGTIGKKMDIRDKIITIRSWNCMSRNVRNGCLLLSYSLPYSLSLDDSWSVRLSACLGIRKPMLIFAPGLVGSTENWLDTEPRPLLGIVTGTGDGTETVPTIENTYYPIVSGGYISSVGYIQIEPLNMERDAWTPADVSFQRPDPSSLYTGSDEENREISVKANSSNNILLQLQLSCSRGYDRKP